MTRSYTELARLQDLESRYHYLALRSRVGEATFGFERHVNQAFYASTQWRNIRSYVIARDSGCDLGVDGFEIHQRIYIHHMNPMTLDDIEQGNPDILDPEFLISVTHRTHNAIHFGDEKQLPRLFVARRAGDTDLWKTPERNHHG